jgi:hypothetical protein
MVEEGVSPGSGNQLKNVLQKLKASGIDFSAIIRRDGVIMEAEMTLSEEERETFAAMTAAMIGAAETATSELKQGIPRRIILDIGQNRLVATGAGPVALLAAFIGPKLDHAKSFNEVDKAAAEVRQILRNTNI